MPGREHAKRVAGNVTGLRRPGREVLAHLVRARNPEMFHFADDGETANNPKWPLVIYRSPVILRSDFDPAAIFEELFASNSWGDSWRDGIYDFLHFHTQRHEALGIARGDRSGCVRGRERRTGAAGGRRRRDPSCGNRPQTHRSQWRPPGRWRLSTKFRRLRPAETRRTGASPDKKPHCHGSQAERRSGLRRRWPPDLALAIGRPISSIRVDFALP